MSHVFISYKREDSHYRDLVIDYLSNANIDFWVDMEIEAGSGWREEIDNALQDSFALILVVTPNTSKSQYITYEWAWALGNKLPIFPLIFEQDKEIHARLQALQLSDCSVNIPESLTEILETKRNTSRLSQYTNTKIAQSISSSIILLIFVELFAQSSNQNLITRKQVFSLFMSLNNEIQTLNWTGMADLWVTIAPTLSPFQRGKLQELGDEINSITGMLNNHFIYGVVIEDTTNHKAELSIQDEKSPLSYNELMRVWNDKLKYIAIYFLDNTHTLWYKDIPNLIGAINKFDIQSPDDVSNSLIDRCFEILDRNGTTNVHLAEIKKTITGRVVTGG